MLSQRGATQFPSLAESQVQAVWQSYIPGRTGVLGKSKGIPEGKRVGVLVRTKMGIFNPPKDAEGGGFLVACSLAGHSYMSSELLCP
jgi:hypothetical protein